MQGTGSMPGTFWKGFVFPGLVACAILSLIAMEVDLGTTILLSTVIILMMFLAGAKRRYLAIGLAAAIGAVTTLIFVVPGRMTRILAVIRPEEFEQSVGLQQKMAKLALGSGGIEGLGLGSGRLKMLYMPFAHTDFIFPMIGEELGMGVTLGVLGCFLALSLVGLLIARRAPDSFGRLLAAGISLCIGFQAVLNIGVTTAVLPNTGNPLAVCELRRLIAAVLPDRCGLPAEHLSTRTKGTSTGASSGSARGRRLLVSRNWITVPAQQDGEKQS